LLNEPHTKVKLPIAVMTDNIGAIFMSENESTGFQTRHVDTRYHFVRKFVRSVENNSDLFTKNGNQELYEKHKTNFLMDSVGRVLEVSFSINSLV
jgi:hypothetical protein